VHAAVAVCLASKRVLSSNNAWKRPIAMPAEIAFPDKLPIPAVVRSCGRLLKAQAMGRETGRFLRSKSSTNQLGI
jgi:hypothetical protein